MDIRPIQTPQQTRAKKVAKAAVATTAVAAATVATSLVLAKKGKLNPTEGGNVVLETLKKGAKAIADTVQPVLDKIATADKIAKLTKAVGEKAQTVKTTVKSGFEAVADKAKKVFTNAKAAITRKISELNPSDTQIEKMAGKFGDKINENINDFAQESFL